jgi:hypothetical protein
VSENEESDLEMGGKGEAAVRRTVLSNLFCTTRPYKEILEMMNRNQECSYKFLIFWVLVWCFFGVGGGIQSKKLF